MKLTARHLQLIEMLARGMTNREIALALNITEGTVKQHLFTLFKKLKAPNRAKAVILGMQWIQQHGMPLPALPPARTVAYLKKVVTSIVIVPRDVPADRFEELALLDHLMAELLAAARPLVQALEGRLMDTRRGGIHVCWGLECSHVDDPQRACLFVRAIHRWLETESQLTVSMALDQQEEIHAWTARDAYFSASYETALQMARKAKGAKVVMTDRFRLALGTGIQANPSRHGWVLDLTSQTPACAAPSSIDEAMAWVESSWRARVPAFLRVFGGTARQRHRAMLQLGQSLDGPGRQCLRLHLPSHGSVTEMAQAVYTQLDAQASLRRRPQGNRMQFQYGDLSPEKAIEAIRLLSLRGPLLLSISGHRALEHWQALVQSQEPATLWPDSPVVCMVADDGAVQHPAVAVASDSGRTMTWPQSEPAADGLDQTLELLQWLDSLEPATKSALQEWLDAHGHAPSPLGIAAPDSRTGNTYSALDHEGLLRTQAQALQDLLAGRVVRPAVASRQS